MNAQIIAVIFQEGGKFISAILRNRSPKRKAQVEYPPVIVEPIEPQEMPDEATAQTEKASSIEVGCVPCAIGHLGTCSGLLNEAMRFARKEGVGSSEVIDRVNICVDELNALERVDLRPELTVNLPSWEKELADEALKASRSARHSLEGMTSVGGLEQATADIQRHRQDIGRDWFKQRLAKMPKKEKAKLAEKAIEKLEKE